jgi:L-2-hydroxyglutarate oxidase LhgO
MKIAVIGAGIVGSAAAFELAKRAGNEVVLYDKERRVGTHQSGHNSGVVHAGLYYTPGSQKARFCRESIPLLKDFCLEHGIGYNEIGKLIVAQSEKDEAGLREIHSKALKNGVSSVQWLSVDELREVEPNVRGRAALLSPETSIVNYQKVAQVLAEEFVSAGGELNLGHDVVTAESTPNGAIVKTANSEREFDRVIVAAGLHTDRIASRSGASKYPIVVPFFGSYYLLNEEDSTLVSHAIYPVPDPNFPFLGVHITPREDGRFMLGPSAYLSLAREGYKSTNVSAQDIGSMLGATGFWKMGVRNLTQAVRLLPEAFGHSSLLRGAQGLVPKITGEGISALERGVRAQAVNRDGTLEDDFVLEREGNVTFLRNGPSPGATSAFRLARELSDIATK